MPSLGLSHANKEKQPLGKHDLEISWLVFVCSAVVLTAFSAVCLDPKKGGLSASAGFRRCVFWFASAVVFAGFVLLFLGSEEATSWVIGYMLEFALSFDNLFLFHMVFTSYATPVDQVYKGIVTAMRWGIVVRFTLFFVSEEVFNLTVVFRWIFGALLLYSGFKIIAFEESEDDPTENCLVRLVTRYLPVHKDYAKDAAFFIFGDEEANIACPSDVVAPTLDGSPVAGSKEAAAHTADPSKYPCWICKGCQATPLFIVILTLMIIDALFAVDSVTAKVSMVSQYDEAVDLFLNFTSTAFAMLCMPNLYFIIALLVNLFKFLKYGLGMILILIGLKLLASDYVHIREDISCLVMVAILGLSVLASLLVSENDTEGATVTKAPEASLSKGEVNGTLIDA
jgi:tellurite resistance protein TerC